jgi:2-polyprenyl-3-methyl-5-hydroxy-6-metoxy-1,4-benzoquinol methylase
MNHVWWRSHFRKLPELGFLAEFGNFSEVDEWMPFLTETLDVPTGATVLELGCGRGSCAIRLAQWGYEVTGVDESAAMLAVAQEHAERRGVHVDLRCTDPRQLPYREAFDGALLLDFGSYPDVDNAELMRQLAAALRPGAKTLFGTFNPYYWSREARTEHRLMEGTDVIRRFQFDFQTGTVVSRVRCIRGTGERIDLPVARYRAYTLPELRALTLACGLVDFKVYGEDGRGGPARDRSLDSLRTPYFHCVAMKPVTGEAGEGI